MDIENTLRVKVNSLAKSMSTANFKVDAGVEFKAKGNNRATAYVILIAKQTHEPISSEAAASFAKTVAHKLQQALGHIGKITVGRVTTHTNPSNNMAHADIALNIVTKE